MASFGYKRDAVGNPLAAKDRDEVIYYGYDGAYRLTRQARMHAGYGQIDEETFTYDAVGNRRTRLNQHWDGYNPSLYWPLDNPAGFIHAAVHGLLLGLGHAGAVSPQ